MCRPSGEPLCQCQGRGHKLICRHDAIDQPNALRFCCCEEVAGQQKFLGTSCSDQPGPDDCPSVTSDDAYPHVWVTNSGVVCRENDIGKQRQGCPKAGGWTV